MTYGHGLNILLTIAVVAHEVEGNTMNEKDISNVMALDVSGRYEYFMKRVVATDVIIVAQDDELLYFNHRDGWAIPVWPDPKFMLKSVELLHIDGLKPHAISINYFMNELWDPPHDNLWIAVMPAENGDAVILRYKDIVEDLKFRLSNTLGYMMDISGGERSLSDLLKPVIKYNMQFGPKGKLPG